MRNLEVSCNSIGICSIFALQRCPFLYKFMQITIVHCIIPTLKHLDLPPPQLKGTSMFYFLQVKKFTSLWYNNATQAYVGCTILGNVSTSPPPIPPTRCPPWWPRKKYPNSAYHPIKLPLPGHTYSKRVETVFYLGVCRHSYVFMGCKISREALAGRR